MRTYADYIKELIDDLEVGEKTLVESCSIQATKTRSYIYYYQKRTGKKFKTFFDFNRNLWAERTA